jgi:chromosome segregation ATPase
LTDQQTQFDVGSLRDSKGLEAVFKSVWDRVRKAAELIEGLKEENRSLRDRVSQLEDHLAGVKRELSEKDDAIRQLREQNLQAPVRGDNVISEEERDMLKSRIKELLTKLNSHL